MITSYNTIKEPCENIIVIEHSKFICNLFNVNNEDEARNFIDSIKKKHSLATHWCYAFIADENGLNQKFSDAGEPSGTAGLPMLEVLRTKKMYKTCAVVTRYFGGIKLGTGGLVRAYSSSVSLCLEQAKICDMQLADEFYVTTDYEGYSRLLKLISTEYIKNLTTDFDNNVTVRIAVLWNKSDEFVKNLMNLFNGKVYYKVVNKGFYDFK